MRHAYLFTLVPALLFAAGLAAQTAESPFPNNQYAPTPKALEMIRYGHLSSHLNGGTMEYNVPIYTLEDRDFTIPISLNYASGGFRPNQQTGEAGLGWTLLAGGAITREIVAIDDMATGGNNFFAGNMTDSLIYALSSPISYDNQNPYPKPDGCSTEVSSDIYHFTMPGHAGNFVYHHTSYAYLAYGTSHGAGAYQITYDETYHCFTIITGDGYEYRFGYQLFNDSTVERTFSRLARKSGESAATLLDDQKTIVTWLLDRIKAPNGRLVEFIYDGHSPSVTIPQEGDDVITTFGTIHKKEDNVDYYKKASITSVKYLKRIVVDSTSVAKTVASFTWTRQSTKEINSSTSSEYSDLVVPTRKLTGITVARGGQTLRQATLTYSAWGTRPLLSTISVAGNGSYSFLYDTSNPTPPDITTNQFDFWGFYNGSGNNHENSYSPMKVDNNNNESIPANSTFRNPNWQCARQGMLTRITYPTGGHTDIQYEANRASKIVLRRKSGDGLQPADPTIMGNYDFLPAIYDYSILFGSNTECGGVRVHSLSDADLTGNISTRSFQYTQSNGISSGIVQQFPRYYVGRVGTTPIYNPSIHFPGSSFDTRHIAYSRVIEVMPDSSRVISVFSDWLTSPDSYSSHFKLQNDTTVVSNDIETIFANSIQREPDSKAYQRGYLTEKTIQDSIGRIIQIESYEYADEYNGSAIPVYSAYIVSSGDYWWSARREICDRRPYRTTIVRYPDTGNTTQTETLTYGYDLLGNRTQIQRTVTDGGTEVEKISYTGNMTSGNAYAGMQALHLLQLPVERTLLRNGKVIRSELTTYALIDSLYHPSAQYRANLDEGVSSFNYYTGSAKDSHYAAAETLFEEYDSRGNVVRSRNRTGVPTSIVYDKSRLYPLAVVYGADNGEESVMTQTTHRDTVIVSGVESYTHTFRTYISGLFTLIFNGSVYLGNGGNTGTLSATLDGNSITLNKFTGSGSSSYFYETDMDALLPAGLHTLVLTAQEPGLLPFDPFASGNSPSSFPAAAPTPLEVMTSGWKMSGTLRVSYAVTEQSTSMRPYTSVFFDDFETTGTTGQGVNNSKGLTSGYNKTIQVEYGKSYILGYLQKTGTKWLPVYTRLTPNSAGTLHLTPTGSVSSPIDQLVLFPEDALAETYSWNPDGRLLSRTSGGGQTEWYTYDNYGRLTEVRDTDHNLVTSYSYSIGGSLSSNRITENTHTGTDTNDYRSTKTFYDGLGRPFETEMAGAWLDGTQVQGSIATLKEYDSSGRPEKQWLATGISGQSYTTPANLKSTAQTSYSDEVPYSQTTYDGSPLDRVRSEAGPGEEWQNAGKKVIYGRLFNNSTAGDDLAIRQYTIAYSSDTEAVITKGTYLPAGTVAIEETLDEDGRRVLVFTNMFGETVLERRFLEGSGNTTVQSDTYYCYDDAGRLVGVLPPMLSAYLNGASGTVFALSSTSEVASYAYLYRYNARGNQIGKKLPGAEWAYYLYDKGDRLVFSQDGNLRGNSKWKFNLTDKLGRTCLTGICGNLLDPFVNTIPSLVVEVTRDYPSLSPSSTNYGYTVSGLTLTFPDVWTVNWYGDYSFLGNWDIPSATATNSPTGFDANAPLYDYGSRQTTLEIGFLTGTMERIIGNQSNNPYIWSVMYYDNRGRTVQQSRKNPMGGWDRTNTGYSYTGLPLKSRTVHFAGMFTGFAEQYTYTYDAWDRPLTVTHGLSAKGPLQTGEYTYGTTSQLHAYRYDFAGRLIQDNRNNANALKTSYDYNLRNWAEVIAVGWNTSNASYGNTFLEELRYQNAGSSSQNPVQWSGNISSLDWTCGNDSVTRMYEFTYDGLSRLTNAVYGDSQNNSGTYSRAYTYDLHGNILSLTTPSGTVNVSYSGNRRAGSYTYDSNGNLTSDQDAGLTGMTYNALNLLSGYTHSADGYDTRITYTASGEKTDVSTEDNQIVASHWHRFGNLIYDNSFSYTRLLVDGGYVDISNAGYTYRFYIQDHQGNNRMVTDDGGMVLQVNHYDPYGQLLSPISSTTAVSEYKYGGKEWSDVTLSYDFGARNYLPAIPRWSTMDPLAEKYYSISPYVYCAGNPVNLVDEEGEKIRIFSAEENQYIVYSNGVLYYQNGHEYDGADGLVWLIANTLNKLIELNDEYITGVINTLDNSKREHTFVVGNHYGDQVSPVGEMGKSLANSGIKTGTWIFLSFNKESFDGVVPTYETTVGHEISHAYDYDQGLQKDNVPSPYPSWRNPTEIRAVNFENRIRYRMNIPLRYKYSEVEIDSAVFENPRKRKKL